MGFIMWRLLLIVLLFLGAGSASVAAQDTPQELAEVDLWLAAKLVELDTIQRDFFPNNGRYWQMLPTSVDGLSATYSVNPYQAPAGHGYTVLIEAVVNGQTWIRSVHVAGPETWRDQPWYVEELPE